MGTAKPQPEHAVLATVPTKRLAKLQEIMTSLDTMALGRMYNRLGSSKHPLYYLRDHVNKEIKRRQLPLPL